MRLHCCRAVQVCGPLHGFYGVLLLWANWCLGCSVILSDPYQEHPRMLFFLLGGRLPGSFLLRPLELGNRVLAISEKRARKAAGKLARLRVVLCDLFWLCQYTAAPLWNIAWETSELCWGLWIQLSSRAELDVWWCCLFVPFWFIRLVFFSWNSFPFSAGLYHPAVRDVI